MNITENSGGILVYLYKKRFRKSSFVYYTFCCWEIQQKCMNKCGGCSVKAVLKVYNFLLPYNFWKIIKNKTFASMVILISTKQHEQL